MKMEIDLGDHPSWRQSRLMGLALKPILEALTTVNFLFLKTHNVPDLYMSGVRYRNEPREWKNEHFDSVPVVLARGWGDCFPVGTPVRCAVGGDRPIETLAVGEKIWGLDKWSTVEAIASKGLLTTDVALLDNGQSVELTGNHHVYVVDDKTEKRIRFSELREGMRLAAPAMESQHVRKITRGVALRDCFDIQTSDNRVYLPEQRVTVSQCDDLSPWRCAELRAKGERAKIRIQWKRLPEGRLFHIVVRRENGQIEDPSARLGMPTPNHRAKQGPYSL